MASVITSAVQTAHAVAASLLGHAQIQPGAIIPSAQVKEDAPDKTQPLNLTGKNIIIGVPGAFTSTCSKQIPGFIENYAKFTQKGVKAIYVVSVNDYFVMKHWKETMAPEGTPIHFIADDTGSFVGSLGLVFDATQRLGNIRSKRFAIITNGNEVTAVVVEDFASNLTVTSADAVLAIV